MNWKRCFVITCSLALVGCGSAADTSNDVSTSPAPPSSESAALNMVTLKLPGMT